MEYDVVRVSVRDTKWNYLLRVAMVNSMDIRACFALIQYTWYMYNVHRDQTVDPIISVR